MAYVQVFATRAKARAELATMIGWPGARVVRRDAHEWAIAIPRGADEMYLREDGYVA